MPTWNHGGFPSLTLFLGWLQGRGDVHLFAARAGVCLLAVDGLPGAPDQEAHGFNIHTIILGFSFSLRNGFSVILFSYIFQIKFSYF